MYSNYKYDFPKAINKLFDHFAYLFEYINVTKMFFNRNTMPP